MTKSLDSLEKALKNKSNKFVAMLAPSFVAHFDYPSILLQLKKLGIDKNVELTFGAKIVNREYHKILKSSDSFLISSVCPGVVETIKSQFPQYKKNLIPIVSPMIATAMVCKKVYPNHKTVFISPCNFKRIEAENSEYVDYAIGCNELDSLLEKHKIKPIKTNKVIHFDKFYNDYTKIYPLAGGLSKTAHINNIIQPNETKVIDGIAEVIKFLKNPDKKVRFLDANFCIGGCIGGPLLTPVRSLSEKKNRVLKYVEWAMKQETIPPSAKGVFEEAEGLDFSCEY